MKRLLPYIAPLLAFVLLICFEQDYLYRAQELSLFLPTPLFLRQCMVASGGLLTWTGAWLTQFFYVPALGTAILCLLWAALIFLLQNTFRLPRQWMLLTIIPVACLLLTVTDLGYWIFFLKLRGHLFDATVGSIVVVLLVFIYLHMPKRFGLRAAFVVVTACAGYPLFGFYALWAVGLMGVVGAFSRCEGTGVRESGVQRYGGTGLRRFGNLLLALLLILAVPLACYYLLFHETPLVNIYWTALPVFCHKGVRYFAYNTPYILLVASTVVMALFYSRERTEKPLALRWKWVQAVLLAAMVAGVAVFWYKDDNFHRELSMMRSIEQQDWQQAVATSADVTGEPTRAICIMRNISLARLGRQGDEMFTYPNGAKRPNSPFPIKMVDTMGRLIYLQYGVVNYCYRWCMENGVEYGWTVEKLKLMAKCSLVNREYAAAQKYLSLLRKCIFQKKWVKKYTEYVHHPQLIGRDRELRAIINMQREDNFLTSDMAQIEQFLMEHFTTAQSSNPVLQEQILVAAMQTKNPSLFWQQLMLYSRIRNNQPLPRHYQEAACLFGHLQHIDMSLIPFDEQVKKDYDDFSRIVGELQRQGRSLDGIRPLVYDRFHTTYFYDFYFNRYNFIEQ